MLRNERKFDKMNLKNSKNGLNAGQSELEVEVLETINGLLLPRKSFEYSIEDTENPEQNIPLTCTPEVIELADAILENEDKELTNGDDTQKWNKWWAREYVSALMATATSGGSYQDYLPGRYLMYERLAESIISLFADDIKGKKIIELGSGSGISLMRIANREALVTGLDTSKIALQFSKYLSQHSGLEININLVNEDFYHTSFPDNEFDAVYTAGVFEHLSTEHTQKLLQEMIRITKPLGYVLIAIPNESSTFYEDLKQREASIFKKFSSFGWVRLPWEERRYPLNLRELMESSGLQVIKEDGLLIAPSQLVRMKNIAEEDFSLFKEYLPREPLQTFPDKITVWRSLEGNATVEQRVKYGWSIYAIGQKR